MTNNDDIFKIIEDITHHLKTLTKEQRIDWFKKNMYIEPLSFTKEIDGTIYVVRTFFKEDAKENIAEKIQRSNLPTHSIENENYSIFGFSQPAKEVGGDFYDYYELDSDNIAVVIGDASGKGIPAALSQRYPEDL